METEIEKITLCLDMKNGRVVNGNGYNGSVVIGAGHVLWFPVSQICPTDYHDGACDEGYVEFFFQDQTGEYDRAYRNKVDKHRCLRCSDPLYPLIIPGKPENRAEKSEIKNA